MIRNSDALIVNAVKTHIRQFLGVFPGCPDFVDPKNVLSGAKSNFGVKNFGCL
jgi:hypothetical protein